MQEVNRTKSLIQKFFEYGVISAEAQDEEDIGYSTAFQAGVFIAFKSRQLSPNPGHWKMHVSLIEDEENLAKAWECAVEVLVEYGIQSSKILRKGCLLQEFQKGKELTIYFQEGNIKWEEMFNKMERLFLENNVRPSYKPLIDQVVKGSLFFSCRCEGDEKLTGLEAETHNPSGKSHTFEEVCIQASPQFSTVKPVRKNEERVKYFYAKIEREYFSLLYLFRSHISRFDKGTIFSEIRDSQIENFYRGFQSEVVVMIKQIIHMGKIIEQIKSSTGNTIEEMDEEVYERFFREKLEACEKIKLLISNVNENMKAHPESAPNSSDGSVVVKGTPPQEERSSGSNERSNSDAATSSSSDESETIQEDFAQRMPLSPRARK